MSKSEKVANYVYVVGYGHSGSTLLELLLAQHPEIVATGELEKMSLQFAREEAPYPGLCSCGYRPKKCFVWAQVADAVARQYSVDIVNNPFRFRISDVGREEDFGVRSFWHWLLRTYCRSWRILAYGRGLPSLQSISSLSLFPRRWAKNRLFVINTIRQIMGSTTVIDSSKDPISMVDLYRLHQGNMKVIFITRDVRGNVWSYAKHGRTSVITAAKNWSKVNRRIRKCLCHVASGDWTQVKYEDMCTAPDNVTRKLWTFLGHDHAESLQQMENKTWHTIGGNKIRRSALNGIVEDFSWKQHLSAEDLELIHHVAGQEAKILRY